MKINFILPFKFLTGGIKVAFEYCNRLQELGNDVKIYIPIKPYKFNNNGCIGLLKRYKLMFENIIKKNEKISWFDLNVEIKLVPSIRDSYLRDADIVVATAWPTAYDVSLLGKKKGKKVYLIQHYEQWSGDKNEVDGSYRLDLNKIVIAKWLKELMKDKFKSDSKLIYNGIDKTQFLDQEKIKNKHITICMMYHKLEWKGFSDGLKAFEIAKDKFPNIKLKLFGTEKGEDIPEYAEFYLNPDKNKLKDIYATSDIYLFPSRCEGWGLTVIEAMACKCAVVGTFTGALEDIGRNNINSLISNTKDIKNLSENLIRAIEDKDLREMLSKNAYESVVDLMWDKSVNKMQEFFNSIV